MIDIKDTYQHVRSREDEEEKEDLHKANEVLDNFVRFVGTIGIEENVLEARIGKQAGRQT
jgi:predicted metal-dependent hydrolase